MTRLLAIGLIAYSYLEIKHNLPQIAERVPNRAVATAISLNLWIPLLLEILITGVLLLVPALSRAYPEAVHFGLRRLSDYTPSQRDRIMPILSRMVGLLSVAATVYFGFGIDLQIKAALVNGRPRPPAPWEIAAFVISFGAITYYYVQRMDEEAGEE
jgi:hypothetical protein